MKARLIPLYSTRRLNLLLYRHGVRPQLIRTVLTLGLRVFALSLLVAYLLLPYTLWFLWFAAGAALAVANFFSLTKHIAQIMFKTYSGKITVALVLRSQLRLVLVASVIVALHVWLGASVPALLAGLTSIAVCIVAASLPARLSDKEK